jgi:hypothetical protein
MSYTRPLQFRQDVLSLITNEWQTSRVIAQQLVLPPDVIARERLAIMRNQLNNCSEIAAKAHIVAGVLKDVCKLGKVEKRKKNRHLNEYRLPVSEEGQSL